MKYKVISECNVVEYYEQIIEASSEAEAIEKADIIWAWDKMDSECENSRTYIIE